MVEGSLPRLLRSPDAMAGASRRSERVPRGTSTFDPRTTRAYGLDGLSALTSLSAVIDIQGESSFFLRYNGYFSHELLNY